MKFQSINEENIATLVRTFYPSVLKDSILAPFFIEKLGEEIEGELWEEHLRLLTEFWKFVALGYDEYKGNPLKPHLDIMGINRDAFMAWLNLFHKTVDELYTPQAGEYFKNKSQEIADNFMRKLSL
ncbi:MAG TPA: group III truncated hemoglobin [Campylobacterales bacterium]|nr:group III truncated hemoglobin [Campylobacterales bacterium]HHS91854.1 group III truncated hemoglobin [Campylobacterales bacterium]